MKLLTASNDEQAKQWVQDQIEWGRKHGQVFNGLHYHEELAGPNGANYTIFVPEGTERGVVAGAQEQCREQCDAVYIQEMVIPSTWVYEVYLKARPDHCIISRILDPMKDRTKLTWPGGRGMHLDMTTGNMIRTVYAELNDDVKAKVRAKANKSPEDFCQLVEKLWKVVG